MIHLRQEGSCFRSDSSVCIGGRSSSAGSENDTHLIIEITANFNREAESEGIVFDSRESPPAQVTIIETERPVPRDRPQTPLDVDQTVR